MVTSVPRITRSVPKKTSSDPTNTSSVPRNAPRVEKNTPSVPRITPRVEKNTPSVPRITSRVEKNTQSVPRNTPRVEKNTPSVPRITQSFKEDTRCHPKNTRPDPKNAQDVAEYARSVPIISSTSRVGCDGLRAEAFPHDARSRDQGKEKGADESEAAENVALSHRVVDVQWDAAETESRADRVMASAIRWEVILCDHRCCPSVRRSDGRHSLRYRRQG